VTIFGGEIAADAVSARSRAGGNSSTASGDFAGTSVTGLVVLGAPVAVSPNLDVPLGDWGRLHVFGQTVDPPASSGPGAYRGFSTALEVVLDADHGGLPAGTDISIAYAETAVEAGAPPAPPAPSPSATRPEPTTPSRPRPQPGPPPAPSAPPTDRPSAKLAPPEPAIVTGGIPGPTTFGPAATTIEPRLTAGGYVFPVYGPSAHGNTFGAPRAVVGWHHGEDIFAPLGAPVLAVADGTVFSVGWNDLGGNRVWLRDAKGNQFYYAHLAAFSPLAADGAHVRAGDVLGFVGNSGDAAGTPYHLHFEVHPASLLFLQYDGVVDPNPYLNAWQRLQDLRIPRGAAWAPAFAPRSTAPAPGAILLQSADISSADGLVPGSLQRAIALAAAEGDGALIGFASGRAPTPALRGG
jgi:murein DD-endopeptidase MepM/ murein hydrolase activator NlpD